MQQFYFCSHFTRTLRTLLLCFWSSARHTPCNRGRTDSCLSYFAAGRDGVSGLDPSSLRAACCTSVCAGHVSRIYAPIWANSLVACVTGGVTVAHFITSPSGCCTSLISSSSHSLTLVMADVSVNDSAAERVGYITRVQSFSACHRLHR